MNFDLQRFSDIRTVKGNAVLSSSKISAGTDSLGNSITDYVKTVSSNNTDLIITAGNNSTYAVTLQSNSDVFSATKNGLVPKPSSANADLFLTAAGTWTTAGGGTVAVGKVAVLDTVASTVEGSMWIVT